MGKLTISMAIFNSFLYVYQRVYEMGKIKDVWNHQPVDKTGSLPLSLSLFIYIYIM